MKELFDLFRTPPDVDSQLTAAELKLWYWCSGVGLFVVIIALILR